MKYAVTNHRSGFKASYKFADRETAERFFEDEADKIGGPVELYELDETEVPIRLIRRKEDGFERRSRLLAEQMDITERRHGRVR